MAIEITGTAKLSIEFEITLKLSAERFNNLTEAEQQDLVNEEIPWDSIMEYCSKTEVELSISKVLRKQKNRSDGSGFEKTFENNFVPTF